MDSKRFRVKDGFDTVNGQRVPQDRMVDLNEAEARYEFDLGKLEPADAEQRPQPEANEVSAAAAGDAGART